MLLPLRLTPMETPTDRPAMLCLVALPGVINHHVPMAFAVINLLDLPLWERYEWLFIGLDPTTEAEWLRWREDNPNAA